MKKQRGICPICRNPIKHPVLDHDHRTDAVRDTVCRNCNRFEGKVLRWTNSVPGDNVELLRSLARYWIRHRVSRHKLTRTEKKRGKSKTNKSKNKTKRTQKL